MQKIFNLVSLKLVITFFNNVIVLSGYLCSHRKKT